MELKIIKTECPDCGEELVNKIGCLGTPVNEFHTFEIEGLEFHCHDCETSVYLELITYSEQEV